MMDQFVLAYKEGISAVFKCTRRSERSAAVTKIWNLIIIMPFIGVYGVWIFKMFAFSINCFSLD